MKIITRKKTEVNAKITRGFHRTLSINTIKSYILERKARLIYIERTLFCMTAARDIYCDWLKITARNWRKAQPPM